MKISLATPSARQVIFVLMLRKGKSLKNPRGLWLGRVTELNKVLSTQQVCREIKTCSGIVGKPLLLVKVTVTAISHVNSGQRCWLFTSSERCQTS